MAVSRYLRSRQLIDASDSALVVIDLQQRLLPHIENHQAVVENSLRLISTAEALSMPAVGTEQYPRGLGATIPEVSEALNQIALSGETNLPAKTMFSCRECESLFDILASQAIKNLILCGVETHVCVAQTALDMIAAGFGVTICIDAVGSRFELDHTTAIRRLEISGCTITTTEAIMFELCERAGTAQFKSISKLVRKKPQTEDT